MATARRNRRRYGRVPRERTQTSEGAAETGADEPPELAVGDGALGTALRDVFPGTREQRCWVHKTAKMQMVIKM